MNAVYIHGINAASKRVPPAESIQANRQRAMNVKTKSFVDTGAYSEGEMLVALMYERYKMYAEYYPEIKAYQTGADIAKNALTNGLHVTANYFGETNEILAPLQKAITIGKRKTNPASGFTTWADKTRNPNTGIGNIDQLDCVELYPFVNPDDFPGQGWVQTHNASQQDKRAACVEENKYRQIFNTHLEKMAVYPLYNYLTASDQLTNEVFEKAAAHKTFFQSISSDSKIDRALIEEWCTNGAIRESIAQGAGPRTPREYIQSYKQEAGVGALLPTFVIPLIVAAIGAMAANTTIWIGVIKGDQTVFQGFKQAFLNTIELIGSLDWGPDAPDWFDLVPTANTPNPGGNQGGGGGGNTIASTNIDPGILAAGAAGLFLLTSK